MNPNATHQRLARMQRECQVSAAPALLLSAACAVLVLMLALSAVKDETTPPQAEEPTRQITSPAA